MTRLDMLKSASGLSGVAHLLGFKAKALSYILYKLPDVAKYSEFEISKRSGGTRTIRAPCAELKHLQRRLSNLLQDCIGDINTERQVHTSISHGFRRKCSIITNATTHKGKRYVFNIDLTDFFGQINFGRVRGFFISNRNFELDPAVATVLAQVACHANALPQGAPSSPVISNLVGHILDIRLAALAAECGCDYSRYADDLTFSTNKLAFPQRIARKVKPTGDWLPGKDLAKEIKRAGFSINPQKTRMQYRQSRQDVTGLVVNTKINVRTEYYRGARAKCHALFRTGAYFNTEWLPNPAGVLLETQSPGTVNQLNGVLSFIALVKETDAAKFDGLRPNAFKGAEKLYSKFLLYKHFFAASRPLIICEGKTDNIYVRSAIKRLYKSYKALAKLDGGHVGLQIDLFNYTDTTARYLGLSGGTGGFNDLIQRYKKERVCFKGAGEVHPVIFLVDNDSGAAPVLQALKQLSKGKQVDKNKRFYKLGHNLYVVMTPRTSADGDTMIEDFFAPTIKATKLGGKTFNPYTPFNSNKEYGKFLFAELVVKKKQDVIDFDGFKPLLDRIAAAIAAHKKAGQVAP